MKGSRGWSPGMCWQCNNLKGTHSVWEAPLEFLQEIFKLHEYFS